MSLKDIVGMLAAALALCWGAYTEFRLRQAQDANNQLRTAFNDQKSKDIIHAESDIDLSNELSKDIS